MYTSDYDVEGIAFDAFNALLAGKKWDYVQLHNKLVDLRNWQDMNSGKVGGKFIYKPPKKIKKANFDLSEEDKETYGI